MPAHAEPQHGELDRLMRQHEVPRDLRVWAEQHIPPEALVRALANSVGVKSCLTYRQGGNTKNKHCETYATFHLVRNGLIYKSLRPGASRSSLPWKKYGLTWRGMLDGTNIVDIGAGVGIVPVVTTLLNPKRCIRIVSLEMSRESLFFLRWNLHENGIAEQVRWPSLLTRCSRRTTLTALTPDAQATSARCGVSVVHGELASVERRNASRSDHNGHRGWQAGPSTTLAGLLKEHGLDTREIFMLKVPIRERRECGSHFRNMWGGDIVSVPTDMLPTPTA